MQTELLITTIYGLLIVAELLILVVILLHRSNQSGKMWFAITLIPVIAVTALQIPGDGWIIADVVSRDFLIWVALIMMAILYGGLIIHDVTRDSMIASIRRAWIGIGGIWVIAFIVTGLVVSPIFTGWANWSETFPEIAGGIGIAGGIVYTLFIMAVPFYFFYIAPIPEVANRAAFWVVTTGLLLVSVTLIASGDVIFMIAGTLVMYSALVITTYGVRHYRLIDVREAVFKLAKISSVVMISWLLIFATLYFLTLSRISKAFFADVSDVSILTLTLAAIALLTAIVIVPTRRLIDFVFARITMMDKHPNIATATAQYSQLVARAATLEEVVNATTETLNRVMGVRRSALILINNTVRVKDSVELIVLEMGSSLTNPTAVGYLHEKSPLYHVMAERAIPLGQYDIDYGPIFDHVAPQEKQFFQDMHLSVYVPVSADNRLIGLLACGAKINDTPYTREDIETLSVIGQQVGTALRSARLIDDLQHLNDSMRVLNKRLEGAKVELEKLDDIKTDFITIASHELRTPLAQIRGYTDILDSLNRADALKEGQADQLVGNLRKSTERMEELISAMLDVSQIDVNSMDLRFIRTSPETIIKMALEPLRDPAGERNIEVVRHDAKELPNIDADLQRMVQALRNIVLNAIKFTPDGGKIEISAILVEAKNESGVDNILFTIADTGVGIDKKDIEFVFNKFYRAFDTQLHSTGIYKFMGAGPGLGLTIAKGIIEGHGGHIWAESDGHDMENPTGTVFFVRLPVEPPSGTRRVLPFADDMNRTQLPVRPVQ